MALDVNVEQEIRSARLSSMFRAVNENLRQLNESFEGVTDLFVVACECSDLDCVEMIEIPAWAYDQVRSSPRSFLVRRGHGVVQVESVVHAGGEWLIVETFGTAAQVAEAEDRRRFMDLRAVS